MKKAIYLIALCIGAVLNFNGAQAATYTLNVGAGQNASEETVSGGHKMLITVAPQMI